MKGTAREVQQLQPLHATLAQAYTPLKAKVDALETDWDRRPASFWQEILTALPKLRAAVQSCIDYAVGKSLCDFSLEFIAIRYSLLSALRRAERLRDETGIAVTSYKSVCRSSEIPHLSRRHAVLETLRKLVEEVRNALDLMGSQLPNEERSQDTEQSAFRCWRQVRTQFATASRREQSISLTTRRNLLVDITLTRSTSQGTLHPKWEVVFRFPGSAFEYTQASLRDNSLTLDEVLSMLHIQPDEVVWTVRAGR